MKKVCVFLADGFEEIEGLTVVDVLRRAKVEAVSYTHLELKQTLTAYEEPLKDLRDSL